MAYRKFIDDFVAKCFFSLSLSFFPTTKIIPQINQSTEKGEMGESEYGVYVSQLCEVMMNINKADSI